MTDDCRDIATCGKKPALQTGDGWTTGGVAGPVTAAGGPRNAARVLKPPKLRRRRAAPRAGRISSRAQQDGGMQSSLPTCACSHRTVSPRQRRRCDKTQNRDGTVCGRRGASVPPGAGPPTCLSCCLHKRAEEAAQNCLNLGVTHHTITARRAIRSEDGRERISCIRRFVPREDSACRLRNAARRGALRRGRGRGRTS